MRLLILLLLLTLLQVCSLGQNNVFGVFRKRRRKLAQTQDDREQIATNRGFAGPHGQPLSVDDVLSRPSVEETFEDNSFEGRFAALKGLLDPLWRQG